MKSPELTEHEEEVSADEKPDEAGSDASFENSDSKKNVSADLFQNVTIIQTLLLSVNNKTLISQNKVLAKRSKKGKRNLF